MKVGRRWCRWLVPALFCLALNGCGYHLGGGGGLSSSMEGKRVAVPLFANRTYRPNLEAVLAGSLRDEVAWRSGGRLVDADRADMIIAGAVLSYTSTPLSYDQDDRIRQYRATVTVEASLRKRETGEIVWKGTRSLSQEYPVMELPVRNQPIAERLNGGSKIALQQNSEEAAVREICRKLAQDLYEKMSEGF